MALRSREMFGNAMVLSIRISLLWVLAKSLRLLRRSCRLRGLHPADRQVHRLKRLVAAPQTFNEKILFRAAWDRRALLQKTADKWQLRTYVSAQIGEKYLPRAYWSGEVVPEERPSNLPETFVAKVSHRSGGVISISHRGGEDFFPSRDGVPLPPGRFTAQPGTLSWRDISISMNAWLSQPYSWGGSICQTPEWAYQGKIRTAFCEEILEPKSGALKDYKFFVFDGQIRMFREDSPTDKGKTMRHFLPDWTEIATIFWEPGQVYKPTSAPPLPPEGFDEAKEVVSFLAKDFDFVRVDTYIFDGRLVIGELTHYPTAGTGHFSPRYLDRWLGNQWSLPNLIDLGNPQSP